MAPRLPDITDLGGLPQVSGERPVASIDEGVGLVARATGNLGEGIGKLGEGIAEYQLDKNHYEYATQHAALVSGLLDLHDEMAADKDYGTLEQRFSEKAAQLQADASQGISNPNLRQRFLEQTAPQMSRAVHLIRSQAQSIQKGAQVSYLDTQGEKFLDQALTAPDEGQRRDVIDAQNGAIDATVRQGAISPEQGLARKQAWAQRYAHGFYAAKADTDPQAVIDELSRPGGLHDVLRPDMREEMLARARSAQKAQVVGQERDYRLAKQQERDASDQEENRIFKDLYSDEPMNTVKSIVNNDTLTLQAKEKLIGVANRTNKPDPISVISRDTTMELLSRMRATDDTRVVDNGPIYQAFFDGKLNKADFKFLNDEFNSARTPEGARLEKDRGTFLKNYESLIDGAMKDPENTHFGEHSVLGIQNMYDFEMDARRQEDVLRKQGKDPHLVYDPRSPEFWGKPENIAKYRVSFQEAQKYDAMLKSMDKARDKLPPAAAPATKPTAFKPPTDWQFSPSRQQYRDPKGKLYDINGQPLQ